MFPFRPPAGCRRARQSTPLHHIDPDDVRRALAFACDGRKRFKHGHELMERTLLIEAPSRSARSSPCGKPADRTTGVYTQQVVRARPSEALQTVAKASCHSPKASYIVSRRTCEVTVGIAAHKARVQPGERCAPSRSRRRCNSACRRFMGYARMVRRSVK